MNHNMNLFKEPFDMIKQKNKTIEVRLNDMKRQNINIGDFITFSKLPDKQDKLTVRVLDIYRFDKFEKLYSNHEFSLFGCKGYTMDQMINETYNIYTKEQEDKYGVLGFKILLI